MYKVFKDVIQSGNFKLADIRHRIQKIYALGDLTEEQVDELLNLASGGVSSDAERPELIAMIQSLAQKIAALEARMDAQDGDTDEDPAEYPAWKPWDGISADYAEGAIVSHGGKLWQSAYPGQNVWEPGAPGTENLWKEYTVENEEE